MNKSKISNKQKKSLFKTRKKSANGQEIYPLDVADKKRYQDERKK